MAQRMSPLDPTNCASPTCGKRNIQCFVQVSLSLLVFIHLKGSTWLGSQRLCVGAGPGALRVLIHQRVPQTAAHASAHYLLFTLRVTCRFQDTSSIIDLQRGFRTFNNYTYYYSQVRPTDVDQSSVCVLQPIASQNTLILTVMENSTYDFYHLIFHFPLNPNKLVVDTLASPSSPRWRDHLEKSSSSSWCVCLFRLCCII